jgi:3-methyladenine DNA glycosylase AlkD
MPPAAVSTGLVKFVQSELAACADEERAIEMAAYMKSAVPFYGVPKPERLSIIRAFKKQYAPDSQAQYLANVQALWQLPHREEKYLAINYAEQFPAFIAPPALSLYEQMVRQGAWWDYVDVIAGHLVGKVLLENESLVRPLVDSYVDDADLWIRRTALLSHLDHKDKTSQKHLFAYCLKLAHEKEFFIRKAIGWALRQYSYSDPEAVRRFLEKNRARLSPLSYNEGAKNLFKTGLLKKS